MDKAALLAMTTEHLQETIPEVPEEGEHRKIASSSSNSVRPMPGSDFWILNLLLQKL